MSEIKRAIDERAARTRNKIADAIIGLGKTRPIDSISVGTLCAAAGISRSTFYAHFDGLRGYLTTSYANMLEGMAARSAQETKDVVRPLAVTRILEHVGASGAYGRAIMQSAHHPAMSAAGEERLTRVVADNLRRLMPAWGEADRTAVATFIAGGFMAMLHRWKRSGMREPAENIRARFESFCDALLLACEPGSEGR